MDSQSSMNLPVGGDNLSMQSISGEGSSAPNSTMNTPLTLPEDLNFSFLEESSSDSENDPVMQDINANIEKWGGAEAVKKELRGKDPVEEESDEYSFDTHGINPKTFESQNNAKPAANTAYVPVTSLGIGDGVPTTPTSTESKAERTGFGKALSWCGDALKGKPARSVANFGLTVLTIGLMPVGVPALLGLGVFVSDRLGASAQQKGAMGKESVGAMQKELEIINKQKNYIQARIDHLDGKIDDNQLARAQNKLTIYQESKLQMPPGVEKKDLQEKLKELDSTHQNLAVESGDVAVKADKADKHAQIYTTVSDVMAYPLVATAESLASLGKRVLRNLSEP